MAIRPETKNRSDLKSATSFNICMRSGLVFLSHLVLIGIASLIFVIDARCGQPNCFREEGFVETAQLVALALGILFFLRDMLKSNPQRRLVATIFSFMLLLAFIRETDGYTDKLVTHGFWKVPAMVVALVAACFLWWQRRYIIPAFVALSQRPAWGILTSGFLTVIVFSRLVGMRPNWISILGDNDNVITIRRAAEEGIELLGYTLLVCGALSFMLDGLREKTADS